MEKDNSKEKTKGIRLKGKRLTWWENNPDAADRIRNFIDKQIEKDKNIKQIKKAPPKLLEGLSKLINKLDEKEKPDPVAKEKITKAENKIDSLIGSS